MRPAEKGFLLLGAHLGDPDRRPLTMQQLRTLAQRVRACDRAQEDRELDALDLKAMGYGAQMADRILALLAGEDVLEHYLRRGRKAGCVPLTRVSEGYPGVIRRRLGLESPGCIWAKGDSSILDMPKISLVGSRDLEENNRRFAARVGRQAAEQGYALVSGNARGADRTAQEACLAAGGKVISVVADQLAERPDHAGILWLSEEDFDAPFSAQRALSRNRVIHAMGEKTFVAQCAMGMGGTWDGTLRNLRGGWSPVYVFADGSEASAELDRMGALSVLPEMLDDFAALPVFGNLFDE